MCSKPEREVIERSIEEISREAIRIKEEGGRKVITKEMAKGEKIIFSSTAVKIEGENDKGLKTHIQLVAIHPETDEEKIIRKIREKIVNAPCISEMITHFTNN